jgi:hypothetical protein
MLLLSLGLHGLLLEWPLPPPSSPVLEPASTPGLPPLPTIAVVTLPPPLPLGRAPIQEPPSPPSPAAPVLPSPPVAPAPVDGAGAEPAVPPPTAPAYNHQARALTTTTESFLDWYIQQDWGSLDPSPSPGRETLAPLQLSYGLGVCLDPPPAPGRLEVIVDGHGALVRSPRLLASTGYDPLDAAALEQARQTVFSQLQSDHGANPRVYWLPLEVQYDPKTCTSSPP